MGHVISIFSNLYCSLFPSNVGTSTHSSLGDLQLKTSFAGSIDILYFVYMPLFFHLLGNVRVSLKFWSLVYPYWLNTILTLIRGYQCLRHIDIHLYIITKSMRAL